MKRIRTYEEADLLRLRTYHCIEALGFALFIVVCIFGWVALP